MDDTLHGFLPLARTAQARARSRSSGRSARRLVPVIYAATFLVFVVDLFRADLLAFGLFYTPLVATGVFYKRRSSVWVLSTVAIVMVVIGSFIPPATTDMYDLVGNRLLSVLAIIATAMFILYARDTQDRLAEQARRIEGAERMKSEVLATLSQEMRTPVHGLLSILSLMTATCRPDQRGSLARVRGGAQHLLESINNIIDLTELDGRAFQSQATDLRRVGRQVAERAQDAARERQITLEPPEEGEPVLAQGDPWAIRRIMENLLTHAILGTRAGGEVSLIVGRAPGLVTAAVNEATPGLRTARTEVLAAEADGPPSNMLGTGLILVHRLAAAIGGEVSTLDQPGGPTRLALSLPAAPPARSA